MSDIDECTVRRVVKRLVDGERLSILIGDGSRPDEIQTARDMTPIRRLLIRDLANRLPTDTPPAATPAVSLPSGQELTADAASAPSSNEGLRRLSGAPFGAPRDSAGTSERTE